MATHENNPEQRSKAKVYEQKEKKGTPAWLWLLPLLALVALGLWWFNRSGNDSATAQTDQLKPGTSTAATGVPDEATRARTGDEWTAAGIADAVRRTGRVSLGDAEVHFATGSATLQGDSQAVLQQVAQALKENSDWKMRVEGHTDATGSAAANQQLAGQRAQAVVSYLMAQGIDQSRLTAVTEYGERDAKTENASETGRAMNRRVELIKE
ncbi:MAG TPA: OmpA family protein [Bryobacteraceae bacterium]|nr:OmpA family protein [Bryobacteraceae bacterium]